MSHVYALMYYLSPLYYLYFSPVRKMNIQCLSAILYFVSPSLVWIFYSKYHLSNVSCWIHFYLTMLLLVSIWNAINIWHYLLIMWKEKYQCPYISICVTSPNSISPNLSSIDLMYIFHFNLIQALFMLYTGGS